MRIHGGLIGPMAVLLGGCDMIAVEPNAADPASIARGKTAAERLGCGACHAMPGVEWPRGKVGPSLDGFAARALIAGRLPNRPDALTRFVRDAPSVVPGTAMPAIAMTDGEAQDIAAWLQNPDGK